MSQDFYPIELLHYAGMSDESLGDVKQILHAHPEFANATTSFRDVQDNALIIASRVGNYKIVQFLMEETQIDYNFTNKDGNAFLTAVKYGHNDIVKYFLDTSIDNASGNAGGQNCFFLYARQGNDTLIELFLEHNLTLNIFDKYQQNVLFSFIDGYASHKNYWCFDLLQENLDIDILFTKNRDGKDIISYIQNMIEQSPTKDEVNRELHLISELEEMEENEFKRFSLPKPAKEYLSDIFAPVLLLLSSRKTEISV